MLNFAPSRAGRGGIFVDYFRTCPFVTLNLVPSGTTKAGMENFSPPRFGGEPGTPVPPVDFDDLKAVYLLTSEIAKRHQGEQFAIGRGVVEQVCKPGADLDAIGFRGGKLGLIPLLAKFGAIAQESVDTIMPNGQFTDAALQAMAQLPMEWIEVGVAKQGMPFDWEQFLRLCAA